jgi:hypothetical protein
MTLRGITFKHTGGADENTDLKNFKLMKGAETLATVASTNSQYVSFVLATPLSINSGNSVSLKVVADVVGGAGETIAFEINSELDVMASSTRYGNAIDVSLVASTFGSVTVKAGTLTLVKINPASTSIREDKDDVVLGSFTVTAAQTGLELKEFGIRVTTSAGGFNTWFCSNNYNTSYCFVLLVQMMLTVTLKMFNSVSRKQVLHMISILITISILHLVSTMTHLSTTLSSRVLRHSKSSLIHLTISMILMVLHLLSLLLLTTMSTTQKKMWIPRRGNCWWHCSHRHHPCISLME